MKTTAQIKELVLRFEQVSNRYQSQEWLASLDHLVSLGAEPFLRLLLETAATKEDRNIRWVIALVLGKVGDEVAVEPLCYLLDDFPSVQNAAAFSLGEIADPRAVDALVEKLTLHEQPKVVRTIGEALAKIGDVRAIEPMRVVLSEVRSRNWGGVSTPDVLENFLLRLEAKAPADAT